MPSVLNNMSPGCAAVLPRAANDVSPAVVKDVRYSVITKMTNIMDMNFIVIVRRKCVYTIISFEKLRHPVIMKS